MAQQPGMSVEQPLWRALTTYRVLTLGYALVLFAIGHADQARAWVGTCYLAILAVWTLTTVRKTTSARRCTFPFLAGDLILGVTGILLSPVADPHDAVNPTLPTIWVAGAVLGFAIKAGWRWAAVASVAIGVANLVSRGGLEASMVHNVLLVCVASIAIGYVVEVARASERTLSRALRLEAATRERERLARDIHDSVLQVLALVQRRGGALGGEAAELGRLAGEQERALRRLISGAALPEPEGGAEPRPGTDPEDKGVVAGAGADPVPPPRAAKSGAATTLPEDGELDLRALLAAHTGEHVTYSGPAGALPLPADSARKLDAAVAAALDNVRRHAASSDGTPGPAWILLEDEPDALLITIRDDGPGIPEGRLAEAEAEGRLGASLSIRGRLRELGGTAEWVSVAGQGTEVELKVPRP